MADVSGASFVGRAAQRAGSVLQMAGAILSVALLLGVGVWGYRLFIRDATGVPVVRAMEGPMRLAPTDPGGEIVLNTGLAVNAVVARVATTPPEDVFVLAPVSAGLAPEDMEVSSMAEAGEVIAADAEAGSQAFAQGPESGLILASAQASEAAALVAGAAPADGLAVAAEPLAGAEMVTGNAAIPGQAMPDQPLTAEQVLALADQIAAGAVPLAPLAAVDGGAAATVLDGAPGEGPSAEALADAVMAGGDVGSVAVAVIPASVPGVAVAIRPPLRPTTLSASVPATDGTNPVAEAALVSTEVIAIGVSLVQLGPFASPELAAVHWDELAVQFAEFLVGKTRLIQAAESAGQVFYRLRAQGFTDLEDARRFCAVLVAENASCIPLVVQ